MANRRMFSKTITSSSQFLMMPLSTQALYFHLGMNADDDGFCEHFAIMRMTESKPDDLKVLQIKKFIHIFDDKILIIKDWKENNYLRADRYTLSKYLKVYNEEIKALSEGKSGIPNGNQRLPQVRLGKVRLGKVRLDKEKRGFTPPSLLEVKNYCEERQNNVNAENFVNFYESKGWLVGKSKMKDWRAGVRTWENRDSQKSKGEDFVVPAYARNYEKKLNK